MQQRKHLLISIYFFILCFTMIFSTINATSSPESIPVQLEINGEKVADAGGAQIIEGRSMVPLKTVTNTFDISLEWFNNSKIIRIDDVSGPIFLKVGEPEVEIDGKSIHLDVPPMILDGQTLVPLRFIAEALQVEIEWYPDQKLIRMQRGRLENVEFERYADQLRVVFDLTTPDKFNVFRLEDPSRLVIDFPGVKYSNNKKSFSINNNFVKSARISQYKESPATVRMVLDLATDEIDYQIQPLNIQNKLVLDITRKTDDNDSQSTLPEVTKKEVLKNEIIVLDPGHGGSNPGALGLTGTLESEINFDISKRLSKLLEEAGAYVITTRKSNQDVELNERAAISNKNSADLFISIHADSHPKPETKGSTIYAHNYASKNSWALAWYIHNSIIEFSGFESKGLKAADFVVLRETKAPAVLIETGYLTNKDDEYLLKKSNHRQKIAQGIFTGIISYYINNQLSRQ